MRDYVKHSKNQDTKYPLEYHEKRVAELVHNEDFLDGLGYKAGIVINFVRHPRATYTLVFGHPS